MIIECLLLLIILYFIWRRFTANTRSNFTKAQLTKAKAIFESNSDIKFTEFKNKMASTAPTMDIVDYNLLKTQLN
jgi:ATP-dependent Zn protease